ncbi:hypothetical protein [uncultured Demequina sp.]|uniref:hypothetical protein n=1 Tax=uncultured Demequina sp. TaxID=693499 RepID=UPI0025F0FD2D|nr:hypothetical protein [uncultured Demequina sp.]
MSDTTQGPDGATPQGWSAPGQQPGAPGLHYGSPASPPPAPQQPAPQIPGAPAPAPTFRSWQPGIIPLRPLTFGDFLSTPFKAMRFNRAVVLGGPLLFTLIATLLSLTAMWLLFTDSRLGLLDATPSFEGINVQTVVMLIVAVVALLLADVLSSSIVAPGVARAVLGERISLGTAWTQMRRRLGSLMLLYVLTTLSYVVLMLIIVAPVIAWDGSSGAILLMLAATLLVLVPAGLVITIGQGIARAMIVLEGISAPRAIARTFRLIRGRFWWSVLIVFVTALLINVVASVLQYVGQFAALISTVIAPENLVILGIMFFVVYGIAFVISMVLTYSYMGSVFAFIYVDLRMRHEGFDLDLARAAEARSGERAAAGS